MDYEKLKMAHELAEKIFIDGKYIQISTEYIANRSFILYRLITTFDEGYDYTFESIDDLIAKLQELTQTKHNYKVGETWWYLSEAHFMVDPKPKFLKITEKNKDWYRRDEEWFPSSKALIQAQIDYWSSLQNEEKSTRDDPCVEEIKKCVHVWERKPQANQDDLIACMKCGESCVGSCEHESDGLGYVDRNTIYKRKYTKCKHCGEFYR